jgi:hypothetical protein
MAAGGACRDSTRHAGGACATGSDNTGKGDMGNSADGGCGEGCESGIILSILRRGHATGRIVKGGGEFGYRNAVLVN